MLDQLIQITNSEEFIDYGDLKILEVHTQPEVSRDLFLKLEIVLEDAQTFESTSQVWEVRCVDTLYCYGNSLKDYKRPYNQIRVYDKHPVLFNYADSVECNLSGTCRNVPELIGSLYLAHTKACGQWVDFSWHFFHIAEHIQSKNQVDLAVPTPLLEVYKTVFQEYGLQCTTIEAIQSSQYQKSLQALIFSNPAVCPDDFNLGQPYQVALEFEEKRIS
jgi:hypothetical protein